MPDYRLGKIYLLTIEDLVYIGATTQPRLSLRLGQHKTAYKSWVNGSSKYMTSFELFKLGTPTIELLELFPCNSKDELHAREGQHQRLNVCVNKQISGRSSAEYRALNQTRRCEQNKQYYYANQTKVCERVKQYYYANQSKISEQKKIYHFANKAKISEQHKQRYAHNKRIELLTLFIQNHIRARN